MIAFFLNWHIYAIGIITILIVNLPLSIMDPHYFGDNYLKVYFRNVLLSIVVYFLMLLVMFILVLLIKSS